MGHASGEGSSWVVHLSPTWHWLGPLGLENPLPRCFFTHISGTIVPLNISFPSLALSLFLFPHGISSQSLNTADKMQSIKSYSQNKQSTKSTGLILSVKVLKVLKVQPRIKDWEINLISWRRKGKVTLQKSKWDGRYWKIESVTYSFCCYSGQKLWSMQKVFEKLNVHASIKGHYDPHFNFPFLIYFG